jgi:hypothetical protein
MDITAMMPQPTRAETFTNVLRAADMHISMDGKGAA